jgi:myo-inositol-1(or 4)-monophosphatase
LPDDDDLALIAAAARAAGEMAMARFGGPQPVREKPGGQGPVTETDLAIDAMLRARLGAARPGYGWLSEETPDTPARLGAGHVFIVDPIDGTRAYAAGERAFAHVIAVAEAGEITAAAVHLPARAETYLAARGAGATRNGRPIRASARAELAGARALAGASQLRPELWPGGPPPVERHFRPSLAWRLCLVAAGEFDAFITLRDAWEWDVAAGDLIAREAGARISTRDGDPPRYNRPRPALPGVIAAAPALHAGLLALLVPPAAGSVPR